MKNKMKKRTACLFLCAALVFGSISSDACAGSEAARGAEIMEVSDTEPEEAALKTEEEKETGREREREDTAEAVPGKEESGPEGENDLKKEEGGPEGESNSKKEGGVPETENDSEKENVSDKKDDQEENTGVQDEKNQQAEQVRRTISGNDPGEDIVLPKEQYHFVEEDQKTVEKWLELYCPNGFEDILTYDEEWWNNLYSYEKEYAEFLLGLIVELSEDVYEEQELSECINILESGVDAWDFFRGTVYEGLTLENLKELYEAGGTLEELTEKNRNTKRRALSMEAQEEGKRVAKVKVSSTGYSGTGHGTIYKITLGGVPALCISYGKSCQNSYLYHADSGTYQKKVGRLGYFASHADVSGATYVACQIAAWLMIESENLSETNVKSRAQAMLNISSEESMEKMLMYIWSFYSAARTSSYAYYEYRSDHPNAQLLIVYKEADSEIHMPPTKPVEPEKPVDPTDPEEPKIENISSRAETSYTIEVHKSDWQTGVGLSGCEVEIFEDGEYLTTVTTDENGYAEYSVTKEAEFSASYDGVTVTKEDAEKSLAEQEEAFKAAAYTYGTGEITAPHGYVWEANEKSETIAGGETAGFYLTNERTLGTVELIKYDTESESEAKQGDAALDGAVYGIYAAQDIIHQDKKTGIIFRKDELVQSAVVGRTPKRNGDGYILNTDGSRHIENPGGEIACEDTPGKTLFGDLELGSYYVKEIQASEGYMLDEAVYPVTLTYKWQMVKIENRDETAKEADNELTADDNSSSKSVYSGDYVVKQGIQFVKTSDNTFQTELKPIEGAGFSVYLISELRGVKDGSIAPIGENWTADDIMAFYEYDFSEEKTAVLYKRSGHEEWTQGDRLWLEPDGVPNRYHVKEMFTDADGRIVTPELPYGTYVIAETTTPEHHVSAKPFIVSIAKDGGVLYTDATKQRVEKTYTPEEGIRYGGHKGTKDREGRVLQNQRIINNTITKAYLRILKADREFVAVPGTYIEAEEFVRGTVLKEGAEYRLKCISMDLSKESLIALNWKYDEKGYMSYYDPNAKIMTGTLQHPFQTGFLKKNDMIRDCYITLPQEIPIGTYELEEITAPEGYVVNGSEQSVLDKSTEMINGYEIIDTPFPKVTFTINNGSVYPDGQMGTNKYALMDEYGNLTVTVIQENQEQKGIVEIIKHGEQLSGAHEDKETLLDKLRTEPFREIKMTPESSHQDLIFEYEDAPVKGAVFEIMAEEDIYSQELRKDLFGQYQVSAADYLIHKKGDLVATIVTDKRGWGYAAGLYIGKYKIVEVTAGEGFVLNTKETEFEITGQKQNMNFDFHSIDYKNERQKLEIEAEKQDRENGNALTGAVYGLYAGEDIRTAVALDADTGKWVLRDEPEVLYPADTLIATGITGEDGKVVFDEDLPLGNYYVKELEGPVGYLTSSEKVLIDGGYHGEKGGQNTEKQEHTGLFLNRKTQTVITKQDIVNRKEIDGALLEIREIETDAAGNLIKDADGNYLSKSVASWVSRAAEIHYFYQDPMGYLIEIKEESKLPEGKELITKKGHLIKGLQTGRIYLLSEHTAPDGYGYAEDIVFRLLQEKAVGEADTEDEENVDNVGNTEEVLTEETGLYFLNGETWNRAPEDILAMYDEKEALEIEKSTIKMTQQRDTYQYTVDVLRNLTGESLEQFTMTDHLPAELYLTELWTGTYNENLLYDAEYMTNRSNGWILWEGGLSTQENHHLLIPKELQKKEEYITKFRFCFGTVEGGFGRVKPPVYMTYVSPEAEGIIVNEIELTAEHNGKKLRDKDRTETILYLKSISGYGPEGGGSPLYEIVGTTPEAAEKEIVLREQDGTGKREGNLKNIEDEDVPMAGYIKKAGVRTGDKTSLWFLLLLSAASAAGLIILWFFRKKKNGNSGLF